MKTVSQIKFDRILKEGFHELLKSVGFKKKSTNFYLQLNTIGQIINIQKSISGNKDNIRFTINTGIFVPQYWLAFYNYSNKVLPDYPTEQECLIRQRIGELRNQRDMWYDITESTDEEQLIVEMRKNLIEFILPYFNKVNSIDQMLKELDEEHIIITPLAKLILYGELKHLDKAQREYDKLLKETTHLNFLAKLKEYGQKYGLV